jgi:hypothetical protein
MIPINHSDTAWLIITDYNQDNNLPYEDLRNDIISPEINQWNWENRNGNGYLDGNHIVYGAGVGQSGGIYNNGVEVVGYDGHNVGDYAQTFNINFVGASDVKGNYCPSSVGDCSGNMGTLVGGHLYSSYK